MAVKDQIEKQIKRTQDDVNEAREVASAPVAAEKVVDEALDVQLAAVKGGYITAAFRTRNGALVVQR